MRKNNQIKPNKKIKINEAKKFLTFHNSLFLLNLQLEVLKNYIIFFFNEALKARGCKFLDTYSYS